jgi:L-malate glycosyltransferase
MWNMDIGGAERAVYQLIREQRRIGMNSNVLVLNNLGLYGNLCRESGADVYSMDMKKSYDSSVKSKFNETISNSDIIHFHSAEPYPIYLSTRNNNVRKYYTHRGGVYPYSFIKSLRYKYCGYLFRKYFSGISGNTSEGARAASILFNIPVQNVAITYNGLDFSLLTPARMKSQIRNELMISENDIILGTSANLKKWKRTEFLIKCIAELNINNMKCLIIGDGPERRNLENLSVELKIRDKIIFAGKKEHIADYLQVVDIFALPSESLESFGNSAVEAMATGIPTIVMKDGGGLPEHILDGETGFIAGSFEDFAGIVKKLTADKELRSRIGEASYKFIREKYSTDKMILNYNKFYGIK